MLLRLFSILSLSLALSCSVEPKPIAFGSDACAFCEMTIVDRQFASEIVSDKGKAYKYDAIECMMRDLKNHKASEVALYLISDFAQEGIFTDALQATYLISGNIPCPMGANLSGFKENAEAKRVQKLGNGQLFNWNELLEQFSK